MGNAIETTIQLRGVRAKDFLQKKGVDMLNPTEDGSFFGAVFYNGEQVDHTLGRMGVEYGLVSDTGNREVVIYSDQLRRKGRKGFRKVSVNRDGVGRQRLTKNVELVVQTNAPATVFQQNRR